MKVKPNEESYIGIVEEERVNDTGNYYADYTLCIDGDIIDNIFRKYNNQKILLTIKRIS